MHIHISAVINRVPPNWPLPRRASWHCVGWLLDEHWILKRNYAVYAYVCIYIYIYMYTQKSYVGDPDVCMCYIASLQQFSSTA